MLVAVEVIHVVVEVHFIVVCTNRWCSDVVSTSR